MSEGAGGTGGRWAAGGMSTFPGFNPRPEHLITDQKNTTEDVNPVGLATFVHARGCEHIHVNINGKVGKLTLENNTDITVDLKDNIVGGTLEMIRCHNVVIRFAAGVMVPVIQVDDSSDVTVYIKEKSQVDCIIFIRSKPIKLVLEDQTVDNESGLTLQYEVSLESDEVDDLQRAGHWTTTSAEADFITERYVRTGKYPTVAQMTNANVNKPRAGPADT